MRRALFYGTALILSHLINFRPKSAHFLDSEFSLSSPYVLYGGLSLVFAYHVLEGLPYAYFAGICFPLSLSRKMPKRAIKNCRKPGRSIKPGKTFARFQIAAITLAWLPSSLVLALIFLGAIFACAYGIYQLITVVLSDSQLVKFYFPS